MTLGPNANLNEEANEREKLKHIVNGFFWRSQFGWLIYLLSAVCAVYRNEIGENNINK